MKIHSASGDARIVSIGGGLTANMASGDVLVANVEGSARVKTASGDIEIAEAGGDIHSKSASGDLQIGAAHGGIISANSVSGRVSVGVIPGVGVWLDLNSTSGSINSELDTSGDPPETHVCPSRSEQSAATSTSSALNSQSLSSLRFG